MLTESWSSFTRVLRLVALVSHKRRAVRCYQLSRETLADRSLFRSKLLVFRCPDTTEFVSWFIPWILYDVVTARTGLTSRMCCVFCAGKHSCRRHRDLCVAWYLAAPVLGRRWNTTLAATRPWCCQSKKTDQCKKSNRNIKQKYWNSVQRWKETKILRRRSLLYFWRCRHLVIFLTGSQACKRWCIKRIITREIRYY